MSPKSAVSRVVLYSTVGVVLISYLTQSLLPIGKELKRSLGYPKEVLLNFTELSAKNGFLSEQHEVVTEDGYILTLFRMTGRNCQRKKTPVLLMHGLLQSSDTWLDAGPDAGLAYLIADECHDLWLGNVRGNYYSRRHIKYDPDKDSRYWNFSVDQIGLYDVPATIDYVLGFTKSETLNYVGYSQGAGVFFIMCSERPGYCGKANVVVAIAPATRQFHTKSKIYRALTKTAEYTLALWQLTHVEEVFSKGSVGQEFLEFFCHINSLTGELCITGKGYFDSFHPGSIGNETVRRLYGHFPAGTSIQNMARYGQSMNQEKFVKFDYGREKNKIFYGSEEAPEYNLTAVLVPVMTLYGRSDGLVDVRDVEWLHSQLPNLVEAHEVKDPLWNHMDVPYSQHTSELLFPKISEYLHKYGAVSDRSNVNVI